MLLRRYHTKGAAPTAPASSLEKEPEAEEYTREDIEKMPYFKVKAVAKSMGIDVADMKVGEIKAAVLEKL